MVGTPCYQVLFCDAPDDRNALISLPFPPYPGVSLQAPWDNGNYHEVDQVFWNTEEGRFEIFAKPEKQ